MSCFRHLEKPIKTKENKRKHFVLLFLYVFIGFVLFFSRRQQVNNEVKSSFVDLTKTIKTPSSLYTSAKPMPPFLHERLVSLWASSLSIQSSRHPLRALET